ncbi:MAG: type I methionyl aminopeptidase [Polyangiaceae bacterium]|nr:type I methionyl aminopeptidase [Polyangiaceae bacterium]
MLWRATSGIELKTPAEVEAMRVVGRMAGESLCMVDDLIRPGLTTDEIDAAVHEDTLRRGAIPAPLHYVGTGGTVPYPRSVCTSVNEVVCHGVPGPRRLAPGDIVNVDITHIFDGFHGDTSATFYVGEPSPEARLVTEVARLCLDAGVAQVRPGARLGDIGAAIQELAESWGCSVVRDFVGHGIGRRFHEEPKVEHYGARGRGVRLRPGMIFTIEPMINLGGHRTRVLDDGWTAVTADGSLSAQFEHTVLVTSTGAEILTQRPRALRNSERFAAQPR